MGRMSGWFKLQLNYSLDWEVMVAHGLHSSAQTKQIKIRERPAYNLKWKLDMRNPPSYELQCELSWSATDWVRPKVHTSHETSRLTWGAHAPLLIGFQRDDVGMFCTQWWEILWLAETLPCNKRAKFGSLAPTTWMILALSMAVSSTGIAFPQNQREANACSSQERRVSCCCMTLSPKPLNHPHFINKDYYNDHLMKIFTMIA